MGFEDIAGRKSAEFMSSRLMLIPKQSVIKASRLMRSQDFKAKNFRLEPPTSVDRPIFLFQACFHHEMK